jgi:hypothetical protein
MVSFGSLQLENYLFTNEILRNRFVKALSGSIDSPTADRVSSFEKTHAVILLIARPFLVLLSTT